MKTPNDDQVGLSVEDGKFMRHMNSSFRKDEEGFLTSPLPFKQIPDQLPYYKAQAYHRAQILHTSLQKDPVKKNQFLALMQKVLDSGAAEEAPSSTNGPCWLCHYSAYVVLENQDRLEASLTLQQSTMEHP